MTYREKIVDYIRTQARPPDKFTHQLRLYELARSLAETESFDDDVLFAAAWMHDLGVFVGHRPDDPAALAKWDNVAYALQKTPNVLKELGFPAGKIPAVLEAIRTHLPSSNPVSFEAVLLRDADILEQLGAVGILRTVSKVGRDTRFTRFSDAVRVLERNAKELPGLLRLASAKAAAANRISVLKEFWKQPTSKPWATNFDRKRPEDLIRRFADTPFPGHWLSCNPVERSRRVRGHYTEDKQKEPD